MINLEKRSLKGRVEVSLFGENGILKSFLSKENITVNAGFRAVCDMMGQVTGQPPGFGYCAIGSGTVAPTAADTLLASELTRLAGAYYRTADTVWKLETTFGAGVGTGTITESGLFNNSAFNSETMLCRQTFGAITKTNADVLVVIWEYTLS